MDYVPLLADLPIVMVVACLGGLWVTLTRPIWIWPPLPRSWSMARSPSQRPIRSIGTGTGSARAASITLAILIVRVCKLEWAEIGIVLPCLRTSRRAIFCGLATVMMAVAVNYVTRDHRVPTLDTLAYEATIPGLSEKLAFRSLFIALYLRAYEDREAAFIVPAAASVAIFGVGHGLAFDGSFHFAWIPAAYAAVLGALLIGMRRVTGSILPAIVAHNLSNVLGDLANAM